MNRQKPPFLQIIICDQDKCPTDKLPVWFPQRKSHKVNVWPISVPWLPAAAAMLCKHGMHSLLSQSRHWRRMLSPKIPSKITSPQTAANSLSNDHSDQILHVAIFTSVCHWRSTSKEHTSDMITKWHLRCNDQIFLLYRNQTWCIAGTISHSDKYVEQWTLFLILDSLFCSCWEWNFPFLDHPAQSLFKKPHTDMYVQ